MQLTTIALAVALGSLAAPIVAAPNRADTASATDFSAWIEQTGPSASQPAAGFPGFAEPGSDEREPDRRTSAIHAQLIAETEPGDHLAAPLPPAIVAGPIGIALAGWLAYRANRRGGRV
jgi:hypothetical protein